MNTEDQREVLGVTEGAHKAAVLDGVLRSRSRRGLRSHG